MQQVLWFLSSEWFSISNVVQWVLAYVAYEIELSGDLYFFPALDTRHGKGLQLLFVRGWSIKSANRLSHSREEWRGKDLWDCYGCLRGFSEKLKPHGKYLNSGTQTWGGGHDPLTSVKLSRSLEGTKEWERQQRDPQVWKNPLPFPP